MKKIVEDDNFIFYNTSIDGNYIGFRLDKRTGEVTPDAEARKYMERGGLFLVQRKMTKKGLILVHLIRITLS